MIDSRKYVGGVLGGLAGGIVFGIMMHKMDMMPMIAKMIGSDSVLVGWIIHFGISATIGFFYAWWFGKQTTSLLRGVCFGILHGVIWWVLGALTIMPLKLGMGVQYVNAFTKMNLMSLMGHIIYGIILGVIVFAMTKNSKK